MTTKKKVEEQKPKHAIVRPKKAVLFELENIAVGGRQVAYDVIRHMLADRKVAVSPVMFSRYYVDSSLSQFLAVAMKDHKTRTPKEKLAGELQEGIRLSLAESSSKVSPGLVEILKKIKSSGVAIGALGASGNDTSRKISGKLSGAGEGLAVLPYDGEGRNAPSPDAWLRLAKELSVKAVSCVVIATSALSSKAALSAGMKCVVAPDSFTCFQDFGGADYIEEHIGSETAGRILALLED